mgnify:CR=1 FL=1
MGIFIAVIVVLLVLIYFMTIMLRSVVSESNQKVNGYFLKNLEMYDSRYKEKVSSLSKINVEYEEVSRELRNMKNEMISYKTSPFYAPRPVPRDIYIPTARYIDNDFFEEYKMEDAEIAIVCMNSTAGTTKYVVDGLREKGIKAEVYPDSAKLKKQMNYANDKQIKFVALIGENEMKENKVSLKNRETGEQTSVEIEEIENVNKGSTKYLGINEIAATHYKYLIQFSCKREKHLQAKRDANGVILEELAKQAK